MPRLTWVTMCSSGMDCVWKDELRAISGQNRSAAQLRISWGVLLSNSSESFPISRADNMRGLYRYNAGVNSDTAARLLAINREFYDRFGRPFSNTRRRLQPGVKRILKTIGVNESVLDLGCGNGQFLQALSDGGHQSPLMGVDFSLSLLRDAKSRPGISHVVLREVDLTQLSSFSDQLSVPVSPGATDGGWDVITMFAVLHHIPSLEIRMEMLKAVRKLVRYDGRVILSNWQFLHSARLRARIQLWSTVGLPQESLDPGDYLLDWRSGGEGLRYVHHFSEQELCELAEAAGMRVIESFTSDGEDAKLGLYQIWRPV